MADPDYFTTANFRLLPDMDDAAKYTEAKVLEAAAYVTDIVEREVGTSFIARTVTDEAHDGGYHSIVLRAPFVQSVSSATEDGVAVTDELRVRSGVLRRFSSSTSFAPLPWSAGVGNVLVTYVSGYSTLATIPADIQGAVMQGTRARLLETRSNSSVDDRRTALTTEAGTINYVIAGDGRPTGYPVVDEVIMGWKRKLNTFGFA